MSIEDKLDRLWSRHVARMADYSQRSHVDATGAYATDHFWEFLVDRAGAAWCAAARRMIDKGESLLAIRNKGREFIANGGAFPHEWASDRSAIDRAIQDARNMADTLAWAAIVAIIEAESIDGL